MEPPTSLIAYLKEIRDAEEEIISANTGGGFCVVRKNRLIKQP